MHRFLVVFQERRSPANAKARQLIAEIRSLRRRNEEIRLRIEDLMREFETIEKKARRRDRSEQRHK